jgi:HK97 family phage major capsid protein
VGLFSFQAKEEKDMAEKAPTGEVTIKMEDLKGILAEALKGMDLPQIQALRDEISKVQKQALFPTGDGDVFETCGKSVVDLGYYQKQAAAQAMRFVDGGGLAARMRSGGGPWLSLSPVMQKFAKIVKAGGDFQKCTALGINIHEYNAEVREQFKSIFGEKATDFLSTTDVGALVPTEFLATVVEFATQESQVLGKLWRIPMSTLLLKIPKLVQAAGSYFGGVVLYHPGEGLEKTLTKPEFDTLTFTAKKLIGLIAFSDELIGDSAINIINYTTGLFVRAFRYKTEGEVLSGTGVNDQMTGILTDSGINEVKRTNTGVVKYYDLLNLESALDENFTALTFLSRRATVNSLRKQVDDNKQPVYHDGFTTFLGAAMQPQLLGYPVIKTRNVPALGTRGDLILGDLSFYIWAMRQEMTIDTSREWRFNLDQTAIRFVVRQDGAPGVSEAFSVLDDGLES